MTIAIFLYVYYIFLAFFFLFAFFVLYHLFKYGTQTFSNFLILVVFMGVTAFILFATYTFAMQVDWSTPLTPDSIIHTKSINLFPK